MPRLLPTGGQRIDVRGAILSTSALAALIFGLSSGQQHGFASVVPIAALAGAIVLAYGFVITERKVAAPMVPRSILSAPTRRAALIAMLLMGAIVAAYVYFVSLYLQRVEGFTPIDTGLALVPSPLTVVLTTTFATRRLLAHFGVKALLLAGLGFIAVGQLWLAQITVGASYATTVLPGQVLTAFGMGLAFPTASVAVTSGVQRSDQGLAGALFTTAQQTGAAIGLAVLATLAAARTTNAHDSLTAGYRFSFLVAAGIAVAAAAIVARQLSSRSCQQELARKDAGESASLPEVQAPLRRV